MARLSEKIRISGDYWFNGTFGCTSSCIIEFDDCSGDLGDCDLYLFPEIVHLPLELSEIHSDVLPLAVYSHH